MQLTLTQTAAQEVRKFMDSEGVTEQSGLRVRVVPGGCSGFQYAMNIEEAPGQTYDLFEC